MQSKDNTRRQSLLILFRLGAALRDATEHVAGAEHPPQMKRLLAELSRREADGSMEKPPDCPDRAP